MSNIENFKKELTDIINKYNMESGSNTPDFILGDYLLECLFAFDSAQKNREKWYGQDSKPLPLPIDKTGKPLAEVFAEEKAKFESRKPVSASPILDKYTEVGGVSTPQSYTERMKERLRKE